MKRAIRYAARCGKFILHAAVGSAVIAMVCGSWIAIGSIFALEGNRNVPGYLATGFAVSVLVAMGLAVTWWIGRQTLDYIDDKVDDFKSWRRTIAYRRSIGAYKGSATKGQS